MKYFLILYFFSFFITDWHIDIGFALKIFMILSIVLLITMFKKIKFTLQMYEIFMLLFFAFYISTSFWAPHPISALRLSLGIVLILMIYVLLKYIFDEYSSEFNMEYLIFCGFLLFMNLSIIMYILGWLSVDADLTLAGKYYGLMLDRSVPRFIGVQSDPNFMGLFITPFFIFFYIKQNKTKKDYFFLYYLCFFLLLTLSVGAIISNLLAIVLYEVYKFISFLNKKNIVIRRKKLLHVLLLLLVLYLIYLLSVDLLGQILDRRLDAVSTGSGRFEMWNDALQLLRDYPFGIGIYNFRYFNNLLYNRDAVMHNTHLEVLVDAGIIGFFLYLIFHLLLFYRLILLKNKKYLYLLYAYIAMMVQLTGLTGVINEVWFLFLAYVAFILKQDVRSKQVCSKS